MKNTYLLLAGLATLGFTSCSNDEPVSMNQGKPIIFRPSMGTRATETTNANLSQINVAAFMGDVPFIITTEYTK